MPITYQATTLAQVEAIHDAIMHRMAHIKKQGSTNLTYIETRAWATLETFTDLSETNPALFAAYNARDEIVNTFLELWATNPSSALFTPYIDNDTGELKLCDYMRDQGLVMEGTDQADLTHFVASPKVSWNKVRVFNAVIRGFFRLTPEVTGLNIVNCDVDGAVIGCGEDFKPVVIKDSSFSYLTYSALTFYNTNCIGCDFLYPRTTTEPVFDAHFQAIINELAQPGMPTSSVLHLHRVMLDGCGFTEFPLSNVWADEATIHNGTFDSSSATLSGVFGDADESFNVIEYIPQKGLMLSGLFPDSMSLTRASTALSFNDIDGGTRLRYADFSNSIITLTAQQDSSTLTQDLAIVDLTGANFTNATVWFAATPYQGLDIATLFEGLGLSPQVVITMTFVAPAQTVTQELTGDDTSYDELRAQTVAYALTNWYCNTTSSEFSPYINHAGQFDLGGYLIGLGFTTTHPATGQAKLADLTDFTLDLAAIALEANPPFSGVSLLDNVMINNASFENGILKLYDTVSTNFILNNVIVEGLMFQTDAAKFVNSQFSNLFFNLFPMQTTMLGQQTCLTFTDCSFENRYSLTTPVALDINNFWVSHFINKCQSSTYATSHNMIFALSTSFDNCKFQDFALNNMYAGLTYVISPVINNTAMQQMFCGVAGSLAEPVMSAGDGQLTNCAYGDGLILQGQWSIDPSFVGVQTAILFLPGMDMEGADFSNSIIFISAKQTFDQATINWANFTSTQLVYEGQIYTGQAIRSLFANLGMSETYLNTITFGPSASSALITGLDDVEAAVVPVSGHETLEESTSQATPLSQNASGFHSDKTSLRSKGKEEQADKTESREGNNKDKGRKDDKENEGSQGPRK